MAGGSNKWVREAVIVGLGLLVAVVSAFLPTFEGWVVTAIAVVAVAAALAVSRRLERQHEAAPAPIPPVPQPGLPPPPRLFVGVGPHVVAERLVHRMLRPGLIAVEGESGIGKSTMCAAAVNTRQIRNGSQRRFWVDAEGAVRRAEIEVLVAGGVGAENLAEALHALGSEPSILVIDHLERFLQGNPQDAATFVDRLAEAAKKRATIIVVAQGHPTWPTSVTEIVEPPLLDDYDAGRLFLEHAPAHAGDDRRFDLIAYVGGLPLAVELLGKTAARCDLGELLVHRRIEHLADGPGASRHANLVVAIELVLNSPVVTDEDRTLLHLVSLLPAGIQAQDGVSLFPDQPLAELRLARLYELGLVRNAGAGVQVVPTIARYLDESGPSPKGALATRTRFVEVATSQARSSGAEHLAWLIAHGANIEAACRDQWPGTDALALAAITRSDAGLVTDAVAELAADVGDEGTAQALGAVVSGKGALTAWHVLVLQYQVIIRIRHRLADRRGEADALQALGVVARWRNRLAEADDRLNQALAVYRDIGHRLGEANALHMLGVVAERRDRLAEAENRLNQALAVYRDIGLRAGEADALRALGVLAQRRDRLAEAENLLNQALAIDRDTTDRRGEANSLHNLGVIAQRRGRLAEAEDLLKLAVAIDRDIGNRLGEANALQELGVVASRRDRLVEADDVSKQALAVYRDIGHRLGEANALHVLGVVTRRRDRLVEADDLFKHALAVYRDIGYRLGEANALHELGVSAGRRDRLAEAEDLQKQALAVYRDIGHRLGEANALYDLGVVAGRRDRLAEAEDLLKLAVAIARDIGDRLGEANALQELGAVAGRRDRLAEAEDLLNQALAIRRDITDRLGQANGVFELAVLAYRSGNLDLAESRINQARTLYDEIEEPAPWIDEERHRIDFGRQRHQEAQEHLQAARSTGSQTDASKAINCLLSVELNELAAAIAEEFSLTITHDGIIHPDGDDR